MRNDRVIRIDDLVNRMVDRNMRPKLVLTGFYADLKMYNEWEKKNQFIPVQRNVSEEYMRKLRAYGYSMCEEHFELSFTDALGSQRNIRISMSCAMDPISKNSGDIAMPEQIACGVEDIDGGHMFVDNVRAIFDITLGRVVMGNGDYMRSNLSSVVIQDDDNLY
ncbi:hypothetical protein pEaSNUABM37_00302 [Erwinia phage pEa_SNUABM_37]|nr:hypothetical protein pEaSNUABM37_00302 [Erwinia phage pEa_SNUABM_37]QXO10770.1 hypothetical protein pEaSNUABM48_00302 [Erwinia phage pEa_SNUABM_48]